MAISPGVAFKAGSIFYDTKEYVKYDNLVVLHNGHKEHLICIQSTLPIRGVAKAIYVSLKSHGV